MLPLGFVAFLVFGVVLVLVGANQADLAAAMDLDMQDSGLLGASLSLGLGLGVLIGGPLIDRYPRRPLFCGATLVAGLALVSTTAEMELVRAASHVGLAGLGCGLFETVLNVIATERYGEKASRPVTFLHMAATLGAVVGAPLLAAIAVEGGFVAGFQATGIAILGLSLWGLVAPALGVSVAPPESPQPTPRPRDLLAHPILVGLCLVSFAYIGVEAALTIFAIPYADGVLGLPSYDGQMAISTFWLGLLVGRLLLLASSNEFQPRLFLLSGAAMATLVAIATGLRWVQIEAWFGLTGLILAGVFPALVTLAGRAFPESRGTAIGLAVGAGSLGGFVIPWAVGWTGDFAGIRLAVGGLALGGVAIAGVALFLMRSPRLLANH